MSLKPRDGIQTINPYKQGKSNIAGQSNPIKLSSNESSLGPSPKAVEAFKTAASSLHRYPDGSQMQLRQAIADVHQLDVEKIICGNGSEELIGLAVRSYINPGDELLLSENHFVMCPIYGRAQGANVIVAPEQDYTVHVDSLLRKVSALTRMVIIANPNNPTGTYIPAGELKRLHAELQPNVLLLIDNAYSEYVTAEDYDTCLDMVEKYENVIATRTFSKIYGLSGLRIGWAYCPIQVIDTLQRIRTPFNTNCAALAAAAAAVKDTGHVKMVREHNAQWLKIITSELKATGIRVIPSAANFYLLSFQDIPNKSGADAAKYLESKGIIPRPAGAEEQLLRITVGLEHENEAVIRALTEFMA